jgi:quinol monooxygenase YgiN
MLIRVVQLDIQEDKTSLFLELYAGHQQTISQNKGCLQLQLLQEDANPNKVATLSHWESEKDLNAYRNSEFFKSLWTKVKPLFASPAKAYSYHIWTPEKK